MSDALLFSPMTVRSVTFENRVWASPMCQYSAVDGVVDTWHLVHLGAFATGGVGLVMTEATAVSPEGRISVGCPGIWSDEQAAAWRRVVDFVHSMGVPAGIQLAHAGRKGSTMRPWDDHVIAAPAEGGWTTVGPSPLAYKDFPLPAELDSAGIDGVVSDFADGAARAVAAGFDVVEIHAAHGYLLHQFMSPLTNHRTDEYGGRWDNRVRIVRRVVEAVRAAVPDTVPVFVRVSATDWVEGGWTSEETVELGSALREWGADLMDVTTGGLVHDAVIPSGPGYQVPFAAAVRAGAGIPVSAVGLITSAQQAEDILERGEADAVMLGRALLRNPRWGLNAAEELGVMIRWPEQLQRARTLNPRVAPQ